jgi:hypothetical protein
MATSSPVTVSTDDATAAFYTQVMHALAGSKVPFLLGGAYALAHYAGVTRATKDLDVFVRPWDIDAALDVLATIGCRTEIAHGHWLGKAYRGRDFVDLIFSSGNGVASVDDDWFAHARPALVLGERALLTPPEEMLWSKAFVMERERYDGADVAHLIHAIHASLDWARLIRRFGPRWRVLLAHLVLFGFIYPGERTHVPAAVMAELLARVRTELEQDERSTEPVCQGTIISREQYLTDVRAWGYADARVTPHGPMTPEQVKQWTESIDGSR